jgi:phospholipid/cholesterol/gamma-HCH transport system substrate-binding protein
VKPVVNKALAVGSLVAVTGAAFLFAFTFFKKGGYSKSESYLVRAHFTDATGLTWKSRVQIAGIQVGEVEKISLDGARALLQIRVKNEVDLREDACLYKAFPSALLPDALLEVAPGKSARVLKDMPEEQREITCIREATSVQQLLDSMARIATDVQTVTGDLAQTVTGNTGSLRNIVENLAATTARLRTLVDENGGNVSQILRNTRDFTHDLKDISGREKERVHDILVNVDELTAQLRSTAASLQAILKGTQASAQAQGGEAGAGGEGGPGGEGGEVAEGGAAPAGGPPQGKGVQQAVEKLNDSLAKLDDILGKVREGKSTAGRLLVDERMGRQVGSAVEGLSDYFDRASRLQVRLQLRSEWLLNQSVTDGRPGAKVYFGARLTPRPDKYFELELVSDPRGVDTVTNETTTTTVDGGTSSTTVTTRTKNEQKLAVSLQMGKRFGRVTLRGGLIESSGGLGADLHMLDDSLRLSLSMYQFNRPQNSAWPRTKLWVDYTFLQHFYVTTGVDDFLNRWETSTRPGGRPFSIGTDVFFGAGIFFNDDDVKMLLTSGVAGGAANAAK